MPIPTGSRTAAFAPWTAVADDATGPGSAAGPANQARLTGLRARGHDLADTAYVADEAVVDADRLRLGDRSYLAAQTHVTGDVTIGADCSVNVFAAVRGRVRIGDGVRIGASTSILGFDHEFADPGVPVRLQGLRTRGITVEDDVWIGAQVVVLDGVRIGAHSVVGAGAVVTRDVPPYAVAVGNPARVVRDRRPGRAPEPATRARALAEVLGATAARDVPVLLDRAWDATAEAFVDAAGVAPTVRAHCDAIELGDLVGLVPGRLTAQEHRERLRRAHRDGREPDDYHVLCVGHALDLLGDRLPREAYARWSSLTPTEVVARLDSLDWVEHAWHAGAVVDTLGTALTWALASDDPEGEAARETLLGWLLTHRDPGTGLWGSPRDPRESVNGTYRLVRGTVASWGIQLGGGDAVVDTVLRHVRAGALDAATACDALDVVHLLWWARPSARGYREAEVADVAELVLGLAVAAWTGDAGGLGAPFAPRGTEMTVISGADPTRPSLQGSEMWLALAWYAADLAGCTDALGYTPRGIHRPD